VGYGGELSAKRRVTEGSVGCLQIPRVRNGGDEERGGCAFKHHSS